MDGNMVSVLIVEDEFIVAEEIAEILRQKGYSIVGVRATGEEALEAVTEFSPDVVLLDIHLSGEMDGVDVAKDIRKNNEQVAVIFLTAYDDEAHLARAKATFPAAYILKPFEEKNLLIAIDLAFSNLDGSRQTEEETSQKAILLSDRVYVKDKDRYVKLLYSDILYFEAVGSYCKILTEERSHTFSFNLKHLLSKVTHPNLIRVSRSHVVNLEKIDAFRGNTIFLGDKPILISPSYRATLAESLKII